MLLFLCGLTNLDDSMAGILRRCTKPVFLTVNKVDTNERLMEASEFYSMGFEHIFFIAAASGSGTGELLDAVAELISEDASEETKEIDALPKFAIIGQPNRRGENYCQ